MTYILAELSNSPTLSVLRSFTIYRGHINDFNLQVLSRVLVQRTNHLLLTVVQAGLRTLCKLHLLGVVWLTQKLKLFRREKI